MISTSSNSVFECPLAENQKLTKCTLTDSIFEKLNRFLFEIEHNANDVSKSKAIAVGSALPAVMCLSPSARDVALPHNASVPSYACVCVCVCTQLPCEPIQALLLSARKVSGMTPKQKRQVLAVGWSFTTTSSTNLMPSSKGGGLRAWG